MFYRACLFRGFTSENGKIDYDTYEGDEDPDDAEKPFLRKTGSGIAVESQLDLDRLFPLETLACWTVSNMSSRLWMQDCLDGRCHFALQSTYNDSVFSLFDRLERPSLKQFGIVDSFSNEVFCLS